MVYGHQLHLTYKHISSKWASSFISRKLSKEWRQLAEEQEGRGLNSPLFFLCLPQAAGKRLLPAPAWKPKYPGLVENAKRPSLASKCAQQYLPICQIKHTNYKNFYTHTHTHTYRERERERTWEHIKSFVNWTMCKLNAWFRKYLE